MSGSLADHVSDLPKELNSVDESTRFAAKRRSEQVERVLQSRIRPLSLQPFHRSLQPLGPELATFLVELASFLRLPLQEGRT